MIEFYFDRDDQLIKNIYAQVEKCREYLQELDKSYNHLSKAA
jgi:hypothetical protein